MNSYVSIKKASKAPRKKKAVPVEKIVSKLKYLKEFKDTVNTVAVFKFNVNVLAEIVAVVLTSAELLGRNSLLSSMTVVELILMAIFAPLNH